MLPIQENLKILKIVIYCGGNKIKNKLYIFAVCGFYTDVIGECFLVTKQR